MDYSDVLNRREGVLCVLDLNTLKTGRFQGYVDGSGRAWISRNGDLDGSVERVSYVDLGCTFHGVPAAYVPRRQLVGDPKNGIEGDPGLYKFARKVAGLG